MFSNRKKGQKGNLLRDFNNFDKGWKWTMENNELDTKVVLHESNLTLYQYRKPTTSECVTNFKFGVSPKSYKLGLISGEVALNEALENLENILVKNLYPRKIVKQKMEEIKKRNFGPSDKKLKRQAELNNPNFKYVTICLPYTSFRSSTVASKIGIKNHFGGLQYYKNDSNLYSALTENIFLYILSNR